MADAPHRSCFPPNAKKLSAEIDPQWNGERPRASPAVYEISGISYEG